MQNECIINYFDIGSNFVSGITDRIENYRLYQGLQTNILYLICPEYIELIFLAV